MNAYLLVGGRSRRMGRSKVELFGDRVASAARQAFDVLFAVHRPGGDAVTGIETLFEPPHDDEAPAFGLARALEHARERCFVLAVDYPHVTADLLRFLRDRGTKSDAAIVMPRWEGELQTLCATYDAPRVAPILTGRLAARRYDLRGLAASVPVEIIDEGELRAQFGEDVLKNVNTPEEATR